jgi:hypothetical protein
MINTSKTSQTASKVFTILALLCFYPYCYFFVNKLFGRPSYILMAWIYGSMALSLLAWLIESYELGNRPKYFKKYNQFARHGMEVFFRTVQVPIKSTWTAAETHDFGAKILANIQDGFTQTYGLHPLGGHQVVTSFKVSAQGHSDAESPCLKVSFIDARGYVFSRFVTYKVLGNNLVVHQLGYFLGKTSLLHFIHFIFLSPLTVATWSVQWARNEYSVYAAQAQQVGNAFTRIDLMSYFAASQAEVANGIIAGLKENNLYNDGLGNNIHEAMTHIHLPLDQIPTKSAEAKKAPVLNTPDP